MRCGFYIGVPIYRILNFDMILWNWGPIILIDWLIDRSTDWSIDCSMLYQWIYIWYIADIKEKIQNIVWRVDFYVGVAIYSLCVVIEDFEFWYDIDEIETYHNTYSLKEYYEIVNEARSLSGFFPHKLSFYGNAFLIMKLSKFQSSKAIRALIASQSTFEI